MKQTKTQQVIKNRLNVTISEDDKNVVNEDIKGHNPYRPQILDHLYRILIIGGSRSVRKLIIFFNKSSTRY